MKEETLELTLSLEETNTVLGALGQMPWLQVAQVIAKIRAQAEDQLDDPQLSASE